MTSSSPRLSRRQFLSPRTSTAKAAPLPLLYTPNHAFFTSMRPHIPMLNADYWSLTIGGLVEHPVTWSYADLMALPMVEIEATLLCAANEPGGERIGHARWRGVSVRQLLFDGRVRLKEYRDALDAGVSQSSSASGKQVASTEADFYVHLEGADGHKTSADYFQVAYYGVLAFEMNGQPLTPEQGFPARLVVPGLYDHKMARWLQRIDLSLQPAIGLWEQSGYSVKGVVDTTSAITSHRPRDLVSGSAVLEGYAFAGNFAIASVEISVDGSAWTPIPFTPGPRGSWSRWAFDWQPASAGDHAVTVRAADETGQVQQIPHTLILRATL